MCISVYILNLNLHLFSGNPDIILINLTQTDLSDKLRDLQWLVVSSQSVQFMVTHWDVKNHIPEAAIEWIMKLLCIRSRLPILFIFFQKKFSFLLPALFMIDSQDTMLTTSTKRPKAYNTICWGQHAQMYK